MNISSSEPQHQRCGYWAQFALLFACFLFLSQTACSPSLAPVGEPIAGTRLTENSFITFDGTELPLRKWLPAENPARAVIIALHGFNDYSNFIAKNAGFFSGHGIAVYAYDQRGFGKAPITGRWSGTGAMARDLAEIVPLIRAEHPGLPLFLLGDSMGGAVVIVTMTRQDRPAVDGVILVAPAVWARSTMPFYQRWLLAFAAHVMPWGVGSGSGLEITPSDNKEMLRELGRDPLVIKESRFDTLYGLADLMDTAYGSAKEYNAKTLLLYGRKDEIIPEKPVMQAFHNFTGEQRLVVYENGYHMLLRDLQAETVMHDIAAWLANPAITALPSSQSGTGQEVTDDDSSQSRSKVSKESRAGQ